VIEYKKIYLNPYHKFGVFDDVPRTSRKDKFYLEKAYLFLCRLIWYHRNE